MSDESTPRAAEDPAPGDPEGAGETSLLIRRALEGDSRDLGRLVERITPLLLASARYRLRGPLEHACDPEDLVQEAWAVFLPRLGKIEARGGRYTPVLLRFLTGTILRKAQNLFQKELRGKPRRASASAGGEPGTSTVDRLPDPVTGVVTRIARRETREQVWASLERLGERDRELVILRGIEQHPYRDIAAVTGERPESLPARYARALEKLRRKLPGSVWAEVIDE